MKLYVWEGVLADYTSGIAFALANSVEEAKSAILHKYACEVGGKNSALINELKNSEPQIIDTVEGFFVFGGG